MNISKEEAQASLMEIESTIARTRKSIATGPSSFLLLVWGVIWLLGFSGVQFLPGGNGGLLFVALDVVGFAITVFAVKRFSVQRSNGWRMGAAWLVLFGYIMLWAFLIHPSGAAGLAFFSTIPMCGYVIFGLWLGRFWVGLGLIVTALTIAGFIFIPAWFALWMALTGGGSLMLGGLFIRKCWK